MLCFSTLRMSAHNERAADRGCARIETFERKQANKRQVLPLRLRSSRHSSLTLGRRAALSLLIESANLHLGKPKHSSLRLVVSVELGCTPPPYVVGDVHARRQAVRGRWHSWKERFRRQAIRGWSVGGWRHSSTLNTSLLPFSSTLKPSSGCGAGELMRVHVVAGPVHVCEYICR